jgi:hypothetical protein
MLAAIDRLRLGRNYRDAPPGDLFLVLHRHRRDASPSTDRSHLAQAVVAVIGDGRAAPPPAVAGQRSPFAGRAPKPFAPGRRGSGRARRGTDQRCWLRVRLGRRDSPQLPQAQNSKRANNRSPTKTRELCPETRASTTPRTLGLAAASSPSDRTHRDPMTNALEMTRSERRKWRRLPTRIGCRARSVAPFSSPWGAGLGPARPSAGFAHRLMGIKRRRWKLRDWGLRFCGTSHRRGRPRPPDRDEELDRTTARFTCRAHLSDREAH